MISKYKSASQLGKVFFWLSVGIIFASIALYIREVAEAMAMDPNSYNCLHDSMMKQVCADPFGTSVVWSILSLVFLGWPILLVWVIIGIVLIARRHKRTGKHE
jgi:hypothetical protein